MTTPESDMAQPQPTKCVSEQETRAAYLKLVKDRSCGKGQPCFRDGCKVCQPVLDLIDERALECDQRGCTPRHCIYD